MLAEAERSNLDVMRQREPHEDEHRTIWLDLYEVEGDGSRDTMMDILIWIAVSEIGFAQLRDLIASVHRPAVARPVRGGGTGAR